ncbi:MAG: helix-turn-helix domain-containing protein [Micromonosporaceae bacterium]
MSRTQDRAVSPAAPVRPPAHHPPWARDAHSSPGGPGDRKQAFAAFVRKALADARAARGWTGTEVARRTGVSRQTIHRWTRGDWSTDPEPERVVAFCEGLGIHARTAFRILGWDRSAPPRPAVPVMDPDIEALLRRLLDPETPDAEKYHIRETVRYLAYRPSLGQLELRRDAS